VSTTADSLPNDLESLRALAARAIAERDLAIEERDAERAEKAKLVAERDKLRGLYEHVHHLLRKANDHRFGRGTSGSTDCLRTSSGSPSKTSPP
jgi:coproporphyrinogen III oxidase-like Fe-S oxidoreductase